MGMLSEFKDFAMKGNVIDLAVGVVIGAAFGKIVSSLVADVIMPIAGFFTGGMDFKDIIIALNGETYASLAAAQEAGAATINLGLFLNAIVQFLIVAFSIFIVVKQINKLSKKQEEEKAEEPAGPTQEDLLAEIRDELRAQKKAA